MQSQVAVARQRFELENEIVQEEDLFKFDEAENERLFKEKPWRKK
jgi:hypothetical protein